VGDNANYIGATSIDEPFDVDKATPTITTHVHDGNHSDVTNTVVAAGTEIHDSAILSNDVAGFSLNGTATVTYYFYTSSDCTGTPVSSEIKTVAIDGTVPESSIKTGLGPGSYCYQAVYSGNDNYTDATSAIEPFTIIQKSIVTNTELCTFGDQITLIYTPDVKNNPLTAKLTASNPGQFYYNIFDNNPTGEMTITLPYPFVTQGATAIHVYSSVTTETVNGETCLLPGDELAIDHQTITLDDYAPQEFGSTADVNITYSDSPTGFVYVNIHVDYGLKKILNNLAPDGDNNAVDYDTHEVQIPEGQDYTFSVVNGISDSATVSSTNVFKHTPGVAGLSYTNAVDDQVYTGQDIMVRLVIPKSVKNAPGPWLEAEVDEDGWYMIEYKHTGKPTNYKFEVYKGSDLISEKTVQLQGNEFEEVMIYLDESVTGGDPGGDPGGGGTTAGTVYVADLQGSSKVTKKSWNAIVTASIQDETGASVPFAKVSGRWIVEGAEIAAYCETDETGTCTVTLNKLDSSIASVGFNVTDVFVDVSAYDAESSVKSIEISQ
jgi:hypothetical protein